MADLLLTLAVPSDIAMHVEDLLLSRPDLARGFTTAAAAGHGTSIPLIEASDLVEGHVPRTLVQICGTEENMRAVLALIQCELPDAKLFYWLVPIIEMGHL